MKPTAGNALRWGLLLVLYWSVLFATSVLELTIDIPQPYIWLALALGLPVFYLVARQTIQPVAKLEQQPVAEFEAVDNVVPFPAPLPDTLDVEATPVSPTSRERRERRMRKLS
jgi:hypothetical protein